MKYTKRAIQSSSIVFILFAVTALLGYLLRIYLSRQLSIEEFGLFFAVVAFVAFFTSFQGFGTSSSLIKFIPEFLAKRQHRSVKSSIMVTAAVQLSSITLFTVVVFVLSEQLSMFFFKTLEAVLILRILMISLLLSQIFRVFQFSFQGFQKVKAYASVEAIRIISTFIFAFFLIGMGTIGVAYAYLLAAITTIIVFLIPFSRLFNNSGVNGSGVNFELAKKLLFFGIPIFLGTMANFVIEYTDTIMISFFVSLSDVGLYQVAIPTSQFLWIFTATISMVMFPMVSELYTKKKKKDLEQSVSLASHMSFFIVVPFAIVIFTFPEIIIGLLFSHKYIMASDALRILAVGSIFYSLFFLFQNILVGIGKSVVYSKLIFKVALLNFVLNLILIPYLGIMGAALTSAASFFTGALASYIYLRKFIAIKLSVSRMSKIFLSAVITVASIFLIKGALVIENPLAEALASIVPSFLIYVLLIFYTKAMTKKDLARLKEMGMPLPKWICD